MPVSSIRIIKRKPYQSSKIFGSTGQYEVISGILEYAVDPHNIANESIVDLKLAPVDHNGLVRFESDFSLLVPHQPDLGNKGIIVDVVNRGRRMAVSNFNWTDMPAEDEIEIPEGDGFLFKQGFSVLSIGWQWDVYRSESLLGLTAPTAQIGGNSISGQVLVEIRTHVREQTRVLSDRNHRPYPAENVNERDAVLSMREWEDGPATIIPREDWSFSKLTDTGLTPSAEHIYLCKGFQPGLIYQVIYTTNSCPVVGTGLLAVRDAASWIRTPSTDNPIVEGFQRVYGYGISQTGRLLRHFVYLGLNLDEKRSKVFDGLLPHVAGGRMGQFNHRFAQPSCQSTAGFGHLFPFADDEMTDVFSNKIDGLLKRQRELGKVPKIIYTNSSTEYWRGDASLIHLNPHTTEDLQESQESRIYLFSGTQHVAGPFPMSTDGLDGSKAHYNCNVVNYAPLLRACLINLDKWVIADLPPPPSSHPKIEDGSAVTRQTVLQSFQSNLDTARPDPDRLYVIREIDLGEQCDQGIGRYPIREGREYLCFVSKVDSDGNEVAGIKLPDLTVPLGTHTGWNPRSEESGAADQLMSMEGFSRFFAPMQLERENVNDSRLSIQERYQDKQQYLTLVRKETDILVEQRYLLEQDVKKVLMSCASLYDSVKSLY